MNKPTPKPQPRPKLTDEQKATLRRNIVAKFAAHVGELEVPKGSNRGDFMDRANEYVGNPHGSAYCLAGATYVAGMAAAQMNLTLEDTSLIKSGYCPDAYNHAKGSGTAVDPQAVVRGEAGVLPGDLVLVFYDHEDKGLLPHHCETVVMPPGKGKPAFTTIGGNTIPDGYKGNEAQGIGVFRKRRKATDKNPSGHNHYVFVRLFRA